MHLVVQGGPAEMGEEVGFDTYSPIWPVPCTPPEGKAEALLSKGQKLGTRKEDLVERCVALTVRRPEEAGNSMTPRLSLWILLDV